MQKKLHIYLLLAFAFWLLPFSAYTQTYPVTISTQLTQPSPIYLSNYANTASINSPIKVQLILNDLTIMNRQVRLKCYFQGAVSFVTNDFVVGAAPIYLEGGFPTQLTNVELGLYFEYQNLQGINPNQYAQPLPEGIYTLSFEVYDFATNKKLSKKSSVTTIIFQNEPPFLNLPANKAEIVEQNIQNIIFSWTPRSINVSNVEYEFSLVEIWNTNTPLQNAFAYSQPLYTTTTRNTTVQYSIAEPQLIPGKTYAWRVKAKALVGAEEIGVFKNNGYSEIFSFKYLTFCKAPLAITTTDVSQDQAKVTWSGEIDNYDYQVNYREKNADSKWYQIVTPREYLTISNLKPKTTYEYTVGAACDPGEYTHSSIQEFTTLAQDEIAFAGCGIKPDPAALSNKTPLPALFPNDVVTAGDFPIVVLKSTGSNGTFSGEGYVTLPFLEKFKELIDAADALGGDKVNIGKYSRIRITFNNIGINTDFKLISGEIVASYDKNWGGMVDGDKLVNDIMGDTGTVIPIDVQFEIKSVVKNPDGTLTITGTNGAVNIQPKTANDVIITDRNGNQYAVSPDAPAGEIKSTGKAAPGGVPTPQNTNGMGSGGNIKEISSPDVTITFAAGTGFYSLDENPNQDPKLKANTKLNSTYDIIPKKDGTSYYVHYKVISDAPKAEDYVTAKATFSNGKTTADIVFKTENGTEIKPVWSGNVATLPLKRTLDFAKESILATVKPSETTVNTTPPSGAGGLKYDIAGTLNLWHATSKKVNVTLVELNGGETPSQKDAQDYLNNIYGKAGIQFEVSTIKVDIADSWGTSIETGDSDLLNTYTDGQQTITNNFQTQLGASYKNDTYYVLFTKVPSSKSGILGFMPLKRQFGFVFAPPSGTGGLRTLAHELGHGIFGLQHPFTEYNTTVTTDLLMDYGTGTALNHNDWEIIHAPGLQLYQFTQGSSAGEQTDNEALLLAKSIIMGVRRAHLNKEIYYPAKNVNVNDGRFFHANNIELNGISFDDFNFKIVTNTEKVNVSKIEDYIDDNFGAIGIKIDSKIFIKVKHNQIEKLKKYFEKQQQNALLFVNGYRFTMAMKKELIALNAGVALLPYADVVVDQKKLFFESLDEYKNSDGTIQDHAIDDYWMGVDTQFSNLLDTRIVKYADGHHSIATSNHMKMENFVNSLYSSFMLTPQFCNLNIVENNPGFKIRETKGTIEGQKFEKELINFKFDKTTEKVDIVCHSMGYACAVGIINYLKSKNYKLGRIYIIAPENAQAGEINPKDFEPNGVWQYGADLNRGDKIKPDPCRSQDGVAPQTMAGGLDETKRLYIPANVSKGFINSHSISNYNWIFKKQKGENGYVAPR